MISHYWWILIVWQSSLWSSSFVVAVNVFCGQGCSVVSLNCVNDDQSASHSAADAERLSRMSLSAGRSHGVDGVLISSDLPADLDRLQTNSQTRQRWTLDGFASERASDNPPSLCVTDGLTAAHNNSDLLSVSSSCSQRLTVASSHCSCEPVCECRHDDSRQHYSPSCEQSESFSCRECSVTAHSDT